MEISKRIQLVQLKKFSSLRIGGEGDILIVRSIAELTEAVMFAKRTQKKIVTLGGGTNSYFGDVLQNILVIKLELQGISLEEKEDTTRITAHAGEVWDNLVQFSVARGLWGIENLSYIPGTVGAAPVQNIGAYGVELKNVLVSLSALDTTTLNLVEMSNSACEFGYRDSLFKHQAGRYIIISITLNLSKHSIPVLTYKPLETLRGGENLTPESVRNFVVATRKAKLPDWVEHPNAGSFFKNPVVTSTQAEGLRATYPDMPLIPHQNGFKIPAAWLIEHIADMRGVRVGDIGTWPNQPLVLVNYGNATVAELRVFTESIIEKIKHQTGVVLEVEVSCV